MKNKMLVLAVVVAVGVLAGTFFMNREKAKEERDKMDSYLSISQDEAMKLMESEKDYIILDVRTPEEFAEGRIKGAINVPNETIGDAEVKELPDKNQLIFVYCRSGNRSRQAAEKLLKLGYTNLKEMGGILTWKGEIER